MKSEKQSLVAHHLKTADDLFDNKPSPRTESMVAVQWEEPMMASGHCVAE